VGVGVIGGVGGGVMDCAPTTALVPDPPQAARPRADKAADPFKTFRRDKGGRAAGLWVLDVMTTQGRFAPA